MAKDRPINNCQIWKRVTFKVPPPPNCSRGLASISLQYFANNLGEGGLLKCDSYSLAGPNWKSGPPDGDSGDELMRWF